MTLEAPVPFPEKNASIVRKAARLTLHNDALDALDLVRDMIGHPNNVQRAVDSWGEAVRVMNESYENISRAHSQVLAQWSGGASASFSTFAGDAKLAVSSNVAAFQGAITATNQMYLAVIAAYKTATRFITNCAQDILNLGGGLLGDWKAVLAVAAAGPTDGASLALIMNHFTDLLSSFAGHVNDLIDGAVDITAGYNSALGEVVKNINAIKPVPGPVPAMADLNIWKPA
ncbi:hypothetical protein [Actinomadura xylanilytica]|uniref:hypothetical protein n=1 Tax=Actinomadura xylanilytica TaxID=887459 RepID=UPI00255AAC92|nr:hypothetical protein [Actinomadura xylanilytica]MDL4772601.1 hypothetical protein [Actinomadura xylanilytica]